MTGRRSRCAVYKVVQELSFERGRVWQLCDLGWYMYNGQIVRRFFSWLSHVLFLLLLVRVVISLLCQFVLCSSLLRTVLFSTLDKAVLSANLTSLSHMLPWASNDRSTCRWCWRHCVDERSIVQPEFFDTAIFACFQHLAKP